MRQFHDQIDIHHYLQRFCFHCLDQCGQYVLENKVYHSFYKSAQMQWCTVPMIQIFDRTDNNRILEGSDTNKKANMNWLTKKKVNNNWYNKVSRWKLIETSLLDSMSISGSLQNWIQPHEKIWPKLKIVALVSCPLRCPHK